jgi:GrpB-like predicted nucleotidyltransferase (UPF0157 family)
LEWGRVFENEEKLLRWHIDDLVDDIQHVGSTSVPCLIAKPIIDIGIAIPARERFEELKDRMVQIGYIYRGDRGNNGGWLLVRESERDFRFIHAHVLETSDPQWRYHYIGFRDRLRADPETNAAYAALKTRNAEQYADDRKAYTNAKHDFVRGIIAELQESDRKE